MSAALAVFDCALMAFPDSKPSERWMVRQDQLAMHGPAVELKFRTLDDAWMRAPDLAQLLSVHVPETAKD